MSHFQNLTRKLTGAGHAKSHDGRSDYLLVVKDDDSTLHLEHWFGEDLLSEQIVAHAVRAGSTAAYLTTLTDTFVIYISLSSTLSACTFDERDRTWTPANKTHKNAPPEHVVGKNGKLAAITDGGGRLHLVFQDSSGQLRHMDHSWKTTVLPVRPSFGSPLAILVVGDTVHIFYVMAESLCLHAVVLENGVWKDMIVLEQEFKSPIRGIIAEETQGGVELLMMTEDHSHLKINTLRSGSSLGSTSRKAKRVHGCANHAWNGTLADANLQYYLKRDGAGCLDKPGGDHGYTPLAAACITGRLATVQLILQSGANPNAPSSHNQTPLFFATSTKEGRDRLAIVRALLEAGAKVDDTNVNMGHATPLMNAVAVLRDRELVVELLRYGASPEKGDNTWRTPADVGRKIGMADLFPYDGIESTVTSFGQSPVSPGSAIISPTVGTSVGALSPDFRSPGLKRSTRRISNQISHPLAPGSPAIKDDGDDDKQEKVSGEAEKPSVFEEKLIDFLATLLMLFVSYTGSSRVKQLMDEAALKLANNGKDDDMGDKHS